MMLLGLIPPYFELAKRNGRVIGISFWFLGIDLAGGLLSLIAIAVQHTFDALGSSVYIIAIVMELGIVASHFIWLFRVRDTRRKAGKAGKSYDDYLQSQKRLGSISSYASSTQEKDEECEGENEKNDAGPSSHV